MDCRAFSISWSIVSMASFPRLARNMNGGGDPHLEDRPRPARITVHSGPGTPSGVVMTVLPGGGFFTLSGNAGTMYTRTGVFDINAEIADSTFDLGMTQQDLHCAQISGLLVDQRGLRPSQ